jgi:hypothetical protein
MWGVAPNSLIPGEGFVYGSKQEVLLQSVVAIDFESKKRKEGKKDGNLSKGR